MTTTPRWTPSRPSWKRAGLLESYTQDDGRIAYRLTAQGASVGRMLAMGDEKADALLGALLDADAADNGPRAAPTGVTIPPDLFR